MKDVFQKGAEKIHSFVVRHEDIAVFEGKQVHPVCSTFVLAREIEWSSRLFVLEMKEEDEEGIGTMLAVNHKSPALVGEEMTIIAKVKSLIENELICDIEVKVEDRIIAVGETGQKILKKEKINKIFRAAK